METSPEIRPLTSIRFVAALMVFLSHYGGLVYRRAEHPWQSIIIEGHAGVTIFFVLSGFLITLRYFPAIAERRFSPFAYFLKRAARILPLYWTVLVLALLLTPLTAFSLYAPVPLANWTLTQAYFSQLATSFIIPAWSLTVEVAFYVLAPVILHFCAAFGQEFRWVCITLAAWVAGLFGAGVALVWIADTGGLNQPYGFMDNLGFMIHFTVFGRGFNFAIGILLAWLYLKYRNRLWLHPAQVGRATLLFALSAIGIGLCQIVMNQAGGALEGWLYNQGVAFFAGFMLLALTCPTALVSRLFSHRLPDYLGRISYALYLTHTISAARGVYLWLVASSGWLATPLFYAAITLASALLYEWIERPGRRMALRAGTWLRDQVTRSGSRARA